MVFGHAGTMESSPWVLPGLSSLGVPGPGMATGRASTALLCQWLAPAKFMIAGPLQGVPLADPQGLPSPATVCMRA